LNALYRQFVKKWNTSSKHSRVGKRYDWNGLNVVSSNISFFFNFFFLLHF